jgi:hypothetical protein
MNLLERFVANWAVVLGKCIGNYAPSRCALILAFVPLPVAQRYPDYECAVLYTL